MSRLSGRVNLPIAFASVTASVLLWWALLPGRLSSQRRPFVLTLALDKPTDFDSHFYIDSQQQTVVVHATMDDEDYKVLRESGRAEVNLLQPTLGAFKYPVSIYPDELRKLVEEPIVQASITLEQIVPKDVPVTVVTSGKLSDPTEVVNAYPPDEKTVRVEGPKSEVQKVVFAQGTLNLGSLTVPSADKVQVALDPVDERNQIVPKVEVRPEQILVTPQFSIAPQQKEVPVLADFGHSTAAPGYTVKSYSIDPQFVTISGSSESLARTAKATTQQIDVSRLTQTQTFKVGLQPLRSDVKISPATVSVTVVIQKQALKDLNPYPGTPLSGGGSGPTSAGSGR